MALSLEDPWGLPSGPGAAHTDTDTDGVPVLNNGNGQPNEATDNDLTSYVNFLRTSFNPLAKDIVEISELPEREGVLFLKHTNYLVQHLVELPDSEQSTDKKVIRRYSDFYWLHQTLLTKYPFRLIPDLPPKRITGTTDQEFLQRRLKGLVRFINQIMKHPVLSQEQLVLMFLTVPTDLSSWRKQANYDSTEEFLNKKISYNFTELWNSNLEQFNQLLDIDTLDKRISNTLDHWSKLTILIERFVKRYEQISSDDYKFNKILNNFNDPGNFKLFNSFRDNDHSTNEISENLSLISAKFKQAGDILNDSNESLYSSTLEKFKNFNDYLISLKQLIERYDSKGGNQIALIQSRIQQTKTKLNDLNKKPDVKGFEVDKLTDLIKNDEKEIEFQANRDWLIKQSLINEIIIFQDCQYQISSCFQDLISNLLKLNELHSNNWSTLISTIQEMPLSRSN